MVQDKESINNADIIIFLVVDHEFKGIYIF